MKYFPLLLFIILFNCNDKKNPEFSAQDIIDQSIEASGGQTIERSKIEFDFRDIHYSALRDKGTFEYIRRFQKDSIEIIDKLSNNGFERLINNKSIKLEDSISDRFTASVNSVHYFSVLPYGLNDAAVNKDFLKETKIGNQNYFEIKVTFDENGGGEDFEDVFVYWINKTTLMIDFLAYSYEEADGKGIRFREAINERFVKGIRFVDYKNYKPADASINLSDLPSLYVGNQLDLVSKIELENIEVKSL
ncbi:MAG: DUF6503 family protein [Bacteroidota bacterium]